MLVAFADLAERLGLRWYVFGAQAVNLHGFPRATADLEDIRELIASRGPALDHERIGELLELLEQALDQSDLVPLYRQLHDEAARG